VRLLAWAGRLIAVTLVASFPWLTHVALTSSSHWAEVVAVLISAQLILAGVVFALRSASPYRWPLVMTGALALAWSWQSAHTSLVAASGVPHALINAGLLFLFGCSLLPGRVPLVTTLARTIDPELPRDMIGYTRRVTAVWAAFFAGQLVVSLVLFLAAPVAVWSLFVNVLNAPLIAFVFLAEYGYRAVHFRNYRHPSISQMIRAFTERAVQAQPTSIGKG
jgi:uncharacterized membrane protein